MSAEVEPIPALPGLPPVCGKPIIARFDGGKLSSDGGVVALRHIEARLCIANRLAASVAELPGPLHRKRLHQPRQRQVVRLPPIEGRLDDIRRQQGLRIGKI
jgi:hypothetical protein